MGSKALVAGTDCGDDGTPRGDNKLTGTFVHPVQKINRPPTDIRQRKSGQRRLERDS